MDPYPSLTFLNIPESGLYYSDDNITLKYNNNEITLSEIIELKNKVDFLEKIIDEIRYIPEIGDIYFKVKREFNDNLDN